MPKRLILPRITLLLTAALLLSCTPKPVSNTGDAAADAAPLSDAAVDASALDAGDVDESTAPTSSEELQTRMKHLVEAIGADNPDLAKDLLYPRDAYKDLKDAKDPSKVWDKRIDAAFRKSVRRLHKRLKGVTPIFTSFALGPSAELVKPKKNDLKKPAWRVKHSKLTFTADGKTHTFEIGEMTAYRGSWYVTRLR